MSKNDPAGKAAMLTELLGEARVADLRKTGVLPHKATKKPDAASVAWHRNRLIEKFRERGLLPRDPSDPALNPGPTPRATRAHKPKSAPEFVPGGLGARLAKHLDPDRLVDEHPSVIALFLRSQTPQLRSQVLRGLPGSQARAVMRILRTGSQGKRVDPEPKERPREKEQAPLEAKEPVLEPPKEAPARLPRTRRAL